MSTSAKAGAFLVVILAVIVLAGTWYAGSGKSAPEVASPAIVEAVPSPSVSPLQGLGLTVESDNSTEAIETDFAAVGKQIEDLDGDTKDFDQSITQ